MNSDKLSRYDILGKLGAGGMGEVYLAQDTELGRRVAIKFLPPELAADERANERLIQEARAAATLDHPNICSIYEAGEADGRSFIAMQYIEGQTLDARIHGAPLELRESLAIASQVADALAEAHAHGIIHRDIKPGNIMITPRGQAKVMDFGLARVMGGAGPVGTETRSLLTAPGTIVGTMPYMSPEQARGEALDARSDIFSFGVVLYEMLSRRQPFARESAAATMAAILTEEPPSLLRHAADLPEALQRIARKCLEKSRERRYQTMRDVATDLDDCRREHETAQAAASRPDRTAGGEAAVAPASDSTRHGVRSSRRVLVAGALLGLLAAAALVAVFVSWRPAATARPPAIGSLAVLPLKSLDAGEQYLGLGIADAVIRRISQTGGLIVRPTSAVRRYLSEDTDALTAARQLSADAVLEGSVQRADGRLRVSVNLLRTSDGASLWAERFDMRMTDIFAIQDAVAQQVASRLQLPLDPSQEAPFAKGPTPDPVAYEFYLKGVYTFDQRVSFTRPLMEATIASFKQAIDADPDFALAHAQLARAYAVKAAFVEPTQPVWAALAKEEIDRAQALDPQLAEAHLARSQLLYSAHGGYQAEAAVREVLLAQQLNRNVGHGELAYLFIHIGLEDAAARELLRASEVDPTSEFNKEMVRAMYEMGGKYDEYAAHRDRYRDDQMEAWYFMGKGRLDEAQRAIDEWSANRPDDVELLPKKALLLALKGDFRPAEAAIPAVLGKHPAKDPFYHHAAYDIALIHALEGRSVEAVKWLREANDAGFQCYPLFTRDAWLNRVRQAPEFIQFMAEMKAQHERYAREFGGGGT